MFLKTLTCIALFDLYFVALIVAENLEISFYLIRVVMLHDVCYFVHAFVLQVC